MFWSIWGLPTVLHQPGPNTRFPSSEVDPTPLTTLVCTPGSHHSSFGGSGGAGPGAARPVDGRPAAVPARRAGDAERAAAGAAEGGAGGAGPAGGGTLGGLRGAGRRPGVHAAAAAERGDARGGEARAGVRAVGAPRSPEWEQCLAVVGRERFRVNPISNNTGLPSGLVVIQGILRGQHPITILIKSQFTFFGTKIAVLGAIISGDCEGQKWSCNVLGRHLGFLILMSGVT